MVAVYKYGLGAAVSYGVGAGREGEGLADDFVAGSYAEHDQSQVYGGCSGTESDDASTLDAEEVGEHVFKEIDVGA